MIGGPASQGKSIGVASCGLPPGITDVRHVIIAVAAFLGLLQGAFGQGEPQPASPIPLGPGARTHELMVGDPAPTLAEGTWLRGGPIDRWQPGHVYVIDFWQTWCAGCIAEFPRLTELQQRHPQRLTVVAVAKADRIDSLETVREFVESSEHMGFAALFDDGGETFRRFMSASGHWGLPTTFVIGPEGRIAAVAQMSGMSLEQIVGGLLDGSYDVGSAADSYRRRRVAGANYATFSNLLNEHRYEEAAAFLGLALRGPLNDSSGLMASVAFDIIDDRVERRQRDLELALRCVRWAVEIDPQDEWALWTLARTHATRGEWEQAIELQEKVIAMANDVVRPGYQRQLEEYRDAARAASPESAGLP
ncbi:MAG: redoxin domain-containing protein [Phycisphaerales bacterium JB039]